MGRNPDPGPYRVIRITATSPQEPGRRQPSQLTTPPATEAVAPAAPVGGPTDRTFVCTGTKRETAESVMATLLTPQADLGGAMVSATNTRTGVVYTFNAAWWDVVESKVGSLIHSIADADACIQGRARRIDFYGPGGRHVGSADANHGITVD
jgi:hypothetical protein